MVEIILLVAQLCTKYNCMVDERSTPKAIYACVDKGTRPQIMKKFTDEATGQPVLVIYRTDCTKI